jgi:hypothetical protein
LSGLKPIFRSIDFGTSNESVRGVSRVSQLSAAPMQQYSVTAEIILLMSPPLNQVVGVLNGKFYCMRESATSVEAQSECMGVNRHMMTVQRQAFAPDVRSSNVATMAWKGRLNLPTRLWFPRKPL